MSPITGILHVYLTLINTTSNCSTAVFHQEPLQNAEIRKFFFIDYLNNTCHLHAPFFYLEHVDLHFLSQVSDYVFEHDIYYSTKFAVRNISTTRPLKNLFINNYFKQLFEDHFVGLTRRVYFTNFYYKTDSVCDRSIFSRVTFCSDIVYVYAPELYISGIDLNYVHQLYSTDVQRDNIGYFIEISLFSYVMRYIIYYFNFVYDYLRHCFILFVLYFYNFIVAYTPYLIIFILFTLIFLSFSLRRVAYQRIN